MTVRNRVFFVSMMTAVAALSAACVQILGIDSTTVANDSGIADASTSDVVIDSSTDAGVDANGPWSCVGNEPLAPAAPSTVTITANITDFISGTPVPGLQLVACLSSRDPSCSSTGGTFTSDDGGVANVTIPVGTAGFTGYLEVTGTVPASDGGTEPIIPYIWHFYQAITQSGTYPLQTFSTDEFSGLISIVQSGAMADSTKGHLAVQATDCTNTPAAGLKLGVSPAPGSEGLTFALRGTSETPTAGLDTTDGSGLVGVFNLDPQNTTLTINRTVDSTELVSEQSVIIRAGWLTTIRMQPNQ